MKKQLFVVLCLIFLGHFIHAQCNAGEYKIRIEIDPDENFQETFVGIATPNFDNALYFEDLTIDGLNTFEFCVPENLFCHKVFVYDEGGDGMIGQGGNNGWFKIFVNDVLVLENLDGVFSNFVTVEFNCPPGASCTQAFDAQLGLDTIPDGRETWYSFIPQNTGTYKFNACGFDNFCKVKFWLYGFCQGLNITDNQSGALFYADGNCADGAEANMYLAGGETYYFRIKYKYAGCLGNPLIFNLTYEGPVKGCTDPNACNYQPLATVSDTCVYDSISCQKLPDLQTDEGLLRSSFILDSDYNSDECAINEGCLRGFGLRHLLRFSTRISNVGEEDYYIGETPVSPDDASDQFIWDPCHLHWHYRGYAEYLLYKADGTPVPIGSKNGFCVLDIECSDGSFGKYTCENMGISAGCGDVYDASLPCQWVDITGLPAGAYTFVVRVNWNEKPDKNGRPEKDYKNNWAQTCFELSYGANNAPNVEFVDQCPSYVDCNGEIFGNAQPDCEGNCNGTAIKGDWNKDTIRNDIDIAAYIQAALGVGSTITPCNDLNDDGVLNVYDAALLQECTLHANDLQYWGSRYACNFPAGLQNPNDMVKIQLGTLNTTDKTLSVKFLNPNQKLLGFQFSVSGLKIDSIEILDPSFIANIQFDEMTGMIIGLSTTESTIIKHNTSKEVLLIHYSTLSGTEVCISGLNAVVNQKYHLSNASIGPTVCLPANPVGIPIIVQEKYGLSVQPNPFGNHSTAYFDNYDNLPVDITMTDFSGKVVLKHEGVRTDQFNIERNSLPSGVYLLYLRGSRGIEVIKLIMQ
jgi:hypothetical protein